VLPDPVQPAEFLGRHGRRVVIAVAGEIGDLDHGRREGRADQMFDICGFHRHRSVPLHLSSRI